MKYKNSCEWIELRNDINVDSGGIEVRPSQMIHDNLKSIMATVEGVYTCRPSTREIILGLRKSFRLENHAT